ncbi:wax ester/triacylglycerol synthase domain-containing protein [Umezawaea beigongshangensis]|uniref:wax ester/triacylglycerol synthase domain-containing protein n=1 Tax=Umezawaea beigongshangensis TaxID=2780383 RepID=UPI0018F249A4|nr:wax ester/triacylglycerol synthase domain-containing protein [Umezawaea beigongshangensis]
MSDPGLRVDLLTRTFLAMERGVPDPADVHFGVLLRCAGPAPRLDELRAHVGARLGRLPALTSRLTGEPAWEQDPDFDVARHVHLVPGLPVEPVPVRRLVDAAPGHDRPLWRAWLLPGDGGVWGLAFAAHHALLDGSGVLHVLRVLFGDHEPAPVVPRAPRGLAVLRVLPNVLSTLRRAPDLPVLGALTGKRRLDHASVALADLRAVADATGTTVGQVHLAALAGAVRRWSGAGERGRDVPVCVPVDTRTAEERDSLGVHLGLHRSVLPTGTADPAARLRITARRLSRRRTATARTATRALVDDVPSRWSGIAMRRLGDRRNVALTASVFRPSSLTHVLGGAVQDVFALPWLPPGHGCFTILAVHGARASLSVLTDTGVDATRDLSALWADEVAVLAAATGTGPARKDTTP